MLPVLALSALVLTIAPEDALPHELSLAEAEEIFLNRGLDLLIAEANAQGAEGDMRAAEAHPNPNLGLTWLYGPPTNHDLVNGNLGTNSTVASQGFDVSINDNAAIEDILSGKRSLRIEVLSKALAAAKLNVQDVKRLELTQLRQAYVAAVMAQLNVNAAQESLDTYDRQLKLNQRRYDEGAIGGLDLSRVKQAELEASQALNSAQAGGEQSLASLAFLLGVRGERPEVKLTSNIDYAGLETLKSATTASLLAQARQNRTDVQMAQATLEQAEAAVSQAKRAVMPDIQLQLGYSEQCNSQNGGCSSAPTFNAGISGNLPVLYQQQGEIRRAESNALSAQRSLDKTKAQVLSDVTQAWASYTAAQQQVSRMESELLKQAKLSRDLAQVMYQKGAASLIDFLDAERGYVASQLEYHQDLANYWTSVYQLEQATNVRLH